MTFGRTPPRSEHDAAATNDRLAGFGHELKTPLSIILGLCARLEAGGRLDGQEAADVSRIRANAHTMLRQVQDMMLVARMDGGLFELEASLSDVAAMVRMCAEGVTQLAADRDLTLEVAAPPHLPALVDRDKLTSALTNLLSNAIAHAPAGGCVRCSLRTMPGTLVIDVADDGPGVPVEARGAIFRRFHTGGRGGTGLGLALVREIASLHGGTITVGDAPEGGALFQLMLPLRARRNGVPGAAVSPAELAG